MLADVNGNARRRAGRGAPCGTGENELDATGGREAVNSEVDGERTSRDESPLDGRGTDATADRAWRLQVGDGAFSPHFHAASELIGRRWTGAIVRALFHGRTRFREIADAIPGISDRLLTERLKELAANGIVERLDGRDGYRLTSKGRDLRPILIEIAKWAHRWSAEASSADASEAIGGTSAPDANGAATNEGARRAAPPRS